MDEREWGVGTREVGVEAADLVLAELPVGVEGAATAGDGLGGGVQGRLGLVEGPAFGYNANEM